MAELESALRDALATHARMVADDGGYAVPPAVVAGVAHRVARLRRRRLGAGAWAAAAVMAVAGALAISVGGIPPAQPVAPGPATRATVATTGGTASSAAQASRSTTERAADVAAKIAAIDAVVPRRSPLEIAEDERLRVGLAADRTFSDGYYDPPGTLFSCGFARLGASVDGTYRYVWAVCGWYAGEVNVSGVSEPMRLQVSGEGATLRLVGWKEPQSGSGYAADVRAMFPAEVVTRMDSSGFESDAGRWVAMLAERDALVQLQGGTASASP